MSKTKESRSLPGEEDVLSRDQKYRLLTGRTERLLKEGREPSQGDALIREAIAAH